MIYIDVYKQLRTTFYSGVCFATAIIGMIFISMPWWLKIIHALSFFSTSFFLIINPLRDTQKIIEVLKKQ